jgi:hypothetical protein
MGSNPAKGNAFLMVIKIQGMTSFRGEVKPEAPYHNILQHVKNLYEV